MRAERKGNRLTGTGGAVLATVLSAIVLASLAFAAYCIREHYRDRPPEAADEPAEKEKLVPLTHDEVLGAPLSFERPAYIRIPAIGVDQEVREGSDDERELYEILALGPIHLTHTGFPGWPGNCVISGHRTTKTRPFNRLDELKAGDAIVIQNPRGVYEYQVYEVFYIDPVENVTLQTRDPILTLTTCAPEGDATQRLVVRSSLKAFTPVEEME